MDETPVEAIRVGSPFAVDPIPEQVSPAKVAPGVAPLEMSRLASPETFYDVGPLRYTALGAVAAAAMVLAFALAALWWFPAGGTLIAGLGCLLSIFGLYSPIPKRSALCLVLHIVLFLACYTQSITG